MPIVCFNSVAFSRYISMMSSAWLTIFSPNFSTSPLMQLRPISYSSSSSLKMMLKVSLITSSITNLNIFRLLSTMFFQIWQAWMDTFSTVSYLRMNMVERISDFISWVIYLGEDLITSFSSSLIN